MSIRRCLLCTVLRMGKRRYAPFSPDLRKHVGARKKIPGGRRLFLVGTSLLDAHDRTIECRTLRRERQVLAVSGEHLVVACFCARLELDLKSCQPRCLGKDPIVGSER